MIKLRNVVKKYGQKMAAGATVLMFVSGSAIAALPAGVSTGITEVQTDGLALADLVWPAVIGLTGASILMKLFKRFSGKI